MRGEPGEKIEGMYACILELEYYCVISLEDHVHENYGTLLIISEINFKSVLIMQSLKQNALM